MKQFIAKIISVMIKSPQRVEYFLSIGAFFICKKQNALEPYSSVYHNHNGLFKKQLKYLGL